MKISAIYDQLGGRDKVADLCDVTSWATYKWDTDGIPPKHWQTLAKKLRVPLEVISAATDKVAEPRPRKARASA